MFFPSKAVVLILSAVLGLSQSVEVFTPNGVIIGSSNLKSRHGKMIYSFVGIPYAQPPVGKLRFKEPQPVIPWKTPFVATETCSPCPQIWLFGEPEERYTTFGQEHCLCLNVHTTSLGPNAKLPVMFYIHGGGYIMGTSGVEPTFLADEVVLVDINYRLGALGFSTTGDGVIPGNLGIKDQILALKWVQQNIAHFGGDPNLVTVFGSSAGGSSTHLILLSPRSKGLVHRGISMSGTATCPWAVLPRKKVVEKTKGLGVLCGCAPEPSEKLLECLRNVPFQDIVHASNDFSDRQGLEIPFSPIIEPPNAEDALITKHPNELSSDIPWITGITSSETEGLPSRFLPYVQENNLDLEEQLDMTISKLLHLDYRFTKERIPSIVNRLKKFYFGDEPITMKNIFKMDDLVADIGFLSGVVESTSLYKGTTYLYYYDYQQSTNVSYSSFFGTGISEKGVSHLDDTLNLFPLLTEFPNRTLSKKDLQVSENHVYLWTTFAKFGNLANNSLTKWEPLDKEHMTNKYLSIAGPEFKQMENLLEDRERFWASFEK